MIPKMYRRAGRVYAQACLLTLAATPLAAATHSVPAGGDLQAALNAAQPGDVIVLAPGATYTGNFKLPVKQGDGYIVVRSGASARSLPPAGTRVTPQHAAALPKIKSPNTAPALSADPGAHHWRIETIEFQANDKGIGDIIVLGGGGSQTQVSQMPRDLIFDRVYIHGDPALGQKRGIALNSGATHVINSHISDIKAKGQDSQAIAGWNGSGPYLIENNYLEAAGENVLFGGADPSVWNLVPSDITIRRNVMSKPLEWRGEKWQVKNAFELKNARRVLVEGNVFEHVWVAAQNGFAVLFTVRNQNGKAPWSVVEDVTFQYNVIRHASGAINLTGFDDLQASAQTRRIRIANNLIYDIGSAWGGKGHLLLIGHSPTDIVFEHNTVLHEGNAIQAHGKRGGAAAPIDNFVFRDNLLRHNKYGVIGDSLGSGNATLGAYFPGAIFERNVLAGGKPSQYPAGNYFPSVEEFEAAFVNAAEEDFALRPGGPFSSASSHGGALGADLGRLNAVTRGGAAQANPGTEGPSAPPPADAPEPKPWPGIDELYWPPIPIE